jgi:hypothetical protein
MTTTPTASACCRAGEGRTIFDLLFEAGLELVECIIDWLGGAVRSLLGLGQRTEANRKLHTAADIVGCLFALILLVLAVVAIVFVASRFAANT